MPVFLLKQCSSVLVESEKREQNMEIIKIVILKRMLGLTGFRIGSIAELRIEWNGIQSMNWTKVPYTYFKFFVKLHQ